MTVSGRGTATRRERLGRRGDADDEKDYENVLTGEDAEHARRTAGALRVAALAAGVAVPLLTVYLIFRLQARQETSVEEVLRVLEHEGLLGDGLDVRKALPGRKRLLAESKGGRDGGGPG